MIEIKDRWYGRVLFSGDYTSIGEAVKAAAKSGADLSGAVLSGAVLSGAVLSGADLSGAVLSGAVLSGAVLRNAVLSGAVLSGADLSGADLSGADLSGAVLSGADLSGADLSGADLSGAVLSGAVLRNAVLSGAVLSGAVLRNAVLSGADLSGAVLSGAVLRNAVLSGADLSGADLSGAVLRNAVLSGAVLSGAKGVTVPAVADLALLLAQPGPMRAYKVVTSDGHSPIHGTRLHYEIGKRVDSLEEPNRDPAESCGAGIHVATPRWVVDYIRGNRYDFERGYFRVLVVEFNRDDLAAIPFSNEGKFRVRGCTPVADVSKEELLSWLGEEKETDDR